MSAFEKRQKQIVELLEETYDLKAEIEKFLLTAGDPLEIRRLKQELERSDKKIEQWQTELTALSNQTLPVQSVSPTQSLPEATTENKLKIAALCFVSGSKDKYLEYANLLGLPGLKWSNRSIEEPQNLDITFLIHEKVKVIKPQLLDTPFFVEHTSLEIAAWNGLPGGLTSQFMSTVGNDGICKMLQGYKGLDRHASAKVVIGYYNNDDLRPRTFEGEISGIIAEKPRGKPNFDWDAIFIPDGDERTYAEMSLDDKNRTSMRKKAADKFKLYLKRNFEFD